MIFTTKTYTFTQSIVIYEHSPLSLCTSHQFDGTATLYFEEEFHTHISILSKPLKHFYSCFLDSYDQLVTVIAAPANETLRVPTA